MELIIKCSIAVILSIFLAGLAVWYRWRYLGREKKAFKDIVKSQLNVLSFFMIFYLFISIIAVLMQRKKEIDNLFLAQSILLWDGLCCIAVIDYNIKKIPNKLLILLILIRAAGILIEGLIQAQNVVSILLSSLLGMFVGGFIMLTCMLLSRGGVGAGDMKLFAIIGLYFGLSGILSVMMYSLFFAAIFSIVMLISKKAKLKSTMPMAPFILAGLSVYYLFL